jgi:hypothetical protein
VRDLPVIDPSDLASVLAVDPDGTAVGVDNPSQPAVGRVRGLAGVWPRGGGMTKLVPPAGHPAVTAEKVAGGRIAGVTWNPAASSSDSDRMAVVWGPDRTAVLAGPLVEVEAMNKSGWLVGENGAARPVLVVGARVLALPEPPGAVFMSQGSRATTVSEDGHVIGGQSTTHTSAVPVRWTCA